MDPRIKAGIFGGESGGDYDALFGFSNRPGGAFAGTRLSDMTVDQAIAFTDPNGPYAQYVRSKVGRTATPIGAYQIVGTTLRAAKAGLGLRGDERMNQQTQDLLGDYILKTQGTGAWEGYKGPREPGEALRHVGGAGSSPANFNRPGEAAAAPYSETPMAPTIDTGADLATLAAQRAARDQNSLADTLASGVGRARSGGRQQQQPVLEQGEASLPPFEFASATPEPVQRQPVQTIQPMSELADLFKVAPVGGAIGINPATGMPMLPRSRRS